MSSRLGDSLRAAGKMRADSLHDGARPHGGLPAGRASFGDHAPRPRQLRQLHLQPRPVRRRAGRRSGGLPERRPQRRRGARARARGDHDLARSLHPARGRHLACRWCAPPRPPASRCSASASATRPSARPSAATVVRADRLMHGKTTDGGAHRTPALRRRCRRRSRPCATTPWSWRPAPCPRSSRSRAWSSDRPAGQRDHGAVPPRRCRCTGCSSTPSRSAPITAKRILANFLGGRWLPTSRRARWQRLPNASASDT